MSVALTNQILKLEKKVSELYRLYFTEKKKLEQYKKRNDTIFKVSELYKELERYKKGYQILIEHFDALPDDIKESVHKNLDKKGL